jgi:hypothetical protein
MNKTPLIAFALLAAGVLPAAPAAARPPSVAYFKTDFTAAQDITWNQDITTHACQGVGRTQGHGYSELRLETRGPEFTKAQRVKDARKAVLTFVGRMPQIGVEGTLERQGDQHGWQVVPAPPGLCGTHYDIPRDCGKRTYPYSLLTLLYDTPKSWSTFDGPAPKVPSLHLRGPQLKPGSGLQYLNCPGERDDSMLGVVTPDPSTYSGAAPLPLKKLFGTRRKFTVSGGLASVADHIKTLNAPNITGTWTATTKLKWTVTFTRRSSRPPGV